ncbi:MAG: electron transfer flavoprotein [Acidimicrobiales bacterium]
MTIAVFCKWCPDPADLEIRSDGSVSLERAKWTISAYDEVALEVGRSLASATTTVVALMAGPVQVDTSLARKAILSRGPEALFMIADDRLADADARQTAAALAAGVGRIGHVDLVLCGAGSADLYAQQVGILDGERLGWPTLNDVMSISLDAASCRIERRRENGVDSLEAPLPVVLALTADAALPRVPGMREILSAGKKPTTVWSLDDLEPSATVGRSSLVLSTVARRGADRQQVLLEGTPAEAANQLVGSLRREGVL